MEVCDQQLWCVIHQFLRDYIDMPAELLSAEMINKMKISLKFFLPPIVIGGIGGIGSTIVYTKYFCIQNTDGNYNEGIEEGKEQAFNDMQSCINTLKNKEA